MDILSDSLVIVLVHFHEALLVVQYSEHSVLIHGTKLRAVDLLIALYDGWISVLIQVKHMDVSELIELVETIACVTSKSS